LAATFLLAGVVGLKSGPSAAQELPANAPPVKLPHPQESAPAATVRLTLEEAKQRALANNKLLNLASLNADSKAFAVQAARADYFPKVVGSVFYFHFNDDLGTVLTGGGRQVTGPKNRPLFTFPTFAVNAAVLNQDSSFATLTAVQPITDLLKVRQGVKIAQADEQIAQAQLEGGIRKLVSGVEQLYWGILAVRRIREGAVQGVQGAELLAKTGILEARTALVEARQGLQDADKQLADLQEQMNALLDLPACTTLELVEPPLPALPFRCADEAVGLALAASPDIHEAQATIQKAQAALAAGKLDYVPSVAVMGGWSNQTGADYIQPNIGFVGVVGTCTFVDWGKRRNVVRERQNLVAMATLKLQQTEDEVRQKAQKAFREVVESQQALKLAQELVELQAEAVKQATTPEAMRNPTALIKAAKDQALAAVGAVKADLAYREAYVQLMALIGNTPCK
jgi:outer membrane protein TolC